VASVAAAIAASALAACGPAASGAPGRVVSVVAAENFWGSLASQLGGAHASVTSVVTDPNADPHEYQASSATARAFARADLVVVNGAGYDSWAQRLLSGSSAPGRRVLDVARLVGVRVGQNPHLWYSPGFVERAIGAIEAAYESLDPADASYFARRRAALEQALVPWRQLVVRIRLRYAGQPVASTESIFVYLARALGLDLVSPPAFMDAVAEGNDPPAASVATFEQQLSTRRVRLLVYNTQTTTAITSTMEALARSRGVPVVGISETVQPPGASFQAWQARQLGAVLAALGG